MKRIHRSLVTTLAMILLLGLFAQTAFAEIYGLAIMNISTRSGPSTHYQDTGTYKLKGQYLQILARAYDNENEIWWVKCVIPSNGRALWTGYKRFDHATLPLDIIPVEGGYYDDGDDYGDDSYYGDVDECSDDIYGLAIMNISTRSGPSTHYQDTGTYNLKGRYLQILARAYDDENEIWWVKCVIPSNGRALWTGYKRFDHASLPLDIIPVEYW